MGGIIPGSIYDYQIYLDERNLDEPNSSVSMYSQYICSTLIFPTTPGAASMFTFETQLVFAHYYYASYTKDFKHLSPKSTVANVEQSLYEIWLKDGKDFTDKLLFYTKERWNPPSSADTDFQTFFALRIRMGAEVTENLSPDFQESDVSTIFEKNLKKSVN